MNTTILDLCCCGGLAADGYNSVGVRPTGVDISPQPSYPYPFQQGDVLDVLTSDLPESFDATHVSPPCQIHTTAGHLRTAQQGTSKYPDLLTPTLDLLRSHWTHKPWIVENVDDNQGKVRAIMAPRHNESLVMLCGSTFGLQVQRHRLFLANFPLRQPSCDHKRFPLDPISGKPRPWGVYHVPSDNVPSGGRTARNAEHAREVMGSWRTLPWNTIKEGFPPAYTAHVGADLLTHLAESKLPPAEWEARARARTATWVAGQRTAGASWSTVASALDVTKQAAQQRFGKTA